jgi:hypothetical protein
LGRGSFSGKCLDSMKQILKAGTKTLAEGFVADQLEVQASAVLATVVVMFALLRQPFQGLVNLYRVTRRNTGDRNS